MADEQNQTAEAKQIPSGVAAAKSEILPPGLMLNPEYDRYSAKYPQGHTNRIISTRPMCWERTPGT